MSFMVDYLFLKHLNFKEDLKQIFPLIYLLDTLAKERY